jgi:enoyl-CoA hydratase/carnithine racemase
MGDFILRETQGRVAILTLNRPDSLNAIGTLQDCDDFVAAIEAVGDDPASAPWS